MIKFFERTTNQAKENELVFLTHRESHQHFHMSISKVLFVILNLPFFSRVFSVFHLLQSKVNGERNLLKICINKFFDHNCTFSMCTFEEKKNASIFSDFQGFSHCHPKKNNNLRVINIDNKRRANEVEENRYH